MRYAPHASAISRNFLKIDRARVCACAGDDELRFKFARLLHELIVIDAVRNGVNAVSRKIIVGAGHVDRRTVGQMAALCKVHAEHGIARLKQREIYGKVRLCAGVRLHIGMLCAEQTASTLTGDVFHNVYILHSRRNSGDPGSPQHICL